MIRDRNYWKRKNIENFIDFVQSSMPEEIELAGFLKHQLNHFMGKDSGPKEEDTQTALFGDIDYAVPVNVQEVVARLFK